MNNRRTTLEFLSRILKKTANQFPFQFLFLLILLSVLSCLSLFSGAEKISAGRFLQSLKTHTLESTIILQLRLPRILLCITSGALLGGSAAVLQGFFRNPLADSGILGLSSGATFGAIISSFLPLPLAAAGFKFIAPVSIFAFAGSILCALAVFSFSMIFRNSSVSLLLAGTATGTFISSINSLLLLFHSKNFHSIIVWTMGSFSGKNWDDFFILLFPSILAMLLLFLTFPYLDILGSGEKTAVSLGLNLNRLRILVLAGASLASSCAVCSGGIISFAGFISPHIARKLFSCRHKKLIPLSMLTGATVLLISDLFARTLLAPQEIPVGIITALLGVPFFITALQKNSSWKQ